MEKGFEITEDKIIIDANPQCRSRYLRSKELIASGLDQMSDVVERMNMNKELITFLEIMEVQNSNKTYLELCSFNEIFNLQGLLISCNIDFSITIREFSLAKNHIESVYYIKSFYIDCYRYLERINGDLGLIKNLATKGDPKIEYKGTFEKLMEFEKKYYQSKIHPGRCNYYAHIKDFREFERYYTNITSLNIQEELDMFADFLDINSLFITLLSKIDIQIRTRFQERRSLLINSVSGIDPKSFYDKIQSLKSSNPNGYIWMNKFIGKIIKG